MYPRCSHWFPGHLAPSVKKGVAWQRKANDSLQSIMDRLEALEEHNSY